MDYDKKARAALMSYATSISDMADAIEESIQDNTKPMTPGEVIQFMKVFKLLLGMYWTKLVKETQPNREDMAAVLHDILKEMK